MFCLLQYWGSESGILTKNDEKLTSDERISIEAMPMFKEWRLRIQPLARTDAQVYTCSGLEGGSVVYEHQVRIIIGGRQGLMGGA